MYNHKQTKKKNQIFWKNTYIKNAKKTLKIENCVYKATSSTSAPSSPKQQPQSLSSSGNEDVEIDGIETSTLTNGKSTENTTESSYENAVAANRTSRASIDAEYENTVQNTVAETNGLNGSASSSSTTNNNNIAKSELTNGNGNGNTNDNGNATDAAKRSSVNDHSNAASKDELYDVPVGEFRIYTISHKNGNK